MSRSLVETLADLPAGLRDAYYAKCDEDRLRLLNAGDWKMVGRPEQQAPPGDWLIWAANGGRGAGKSRAGSEFVLDRHEAGSSKAVLVGRRAKDVREVLIEGASGLLACAKRRGIDARWVPSRSRVDLRSDHGKTACTTILGDEPEDAAGMEMDTAWLDEWSSYIVKRDGAGRTTLDNVLLGLRSPVLAPKAVLTSTPRPLLVIRDVLNRPDVVTTQLTMFDNSRNLAPSFIEGIRQRYEGTRLERQEIYGEMVGAEGVYFTRTDWVILDETPPLSMQVRYWDLAHARASAQNPDPDWTVGLKLGTDGVREVVLDVRRVRGNQLDVESLIIETAHTDGPAVQQVMEQTPGAGKGLAEVMVRACAGANPPVRLALDPVTKAKERRAETPSLRVQQGRLQATHGVWLDGFLDECEAFPDPAVHDDQVDALSGAVLWVDRNRRGTSSVKRPPAITLASPTRRGG